MPPRRSLEPHVAQETPPQVPPDPYTGREEKEVRFSGLYINHPDDWIPRVATLDAQTAREIMACWTEENTDGTPDPVTDYLRKIVEQSQADPHTDQAKDEMPPRRSPDPYTDREMSPRRSLDPYTDREMPPRVPIDPYTGREKQWEPQRLVSDPMADFLRIVGHRKIFEPYTGQDEDEDEDEDETPPEVPPVPHVDQARARVPQQQRPPDPYTDQAEDVTPPRRSLVPHVEQARVRVVPPVPHVEQARARVPQQQRPPDPHVDQAEDVTPPRRSLDPHVGREMLPQVPLDPYTGEEKPWEPQRLVSDPMADFLRIVGHRKIFDPYTGQDEDEDEDETPPEVPPDPHVDQARAPEVPPVPHVDQARARVPQQQRPPDPYTDQAEDVTPPRRSPDPHVDQGIGSRSALSTGNRSALSDPPLEQARGDSPRPDRLIPRLGGQTSSEQTIPRDPHVDQTRIPRDPHADQISSFSDSRAGGGREGRKDGGREGSVPPPEQIFSVRPPTPEALLFAQHPLWVPGGLSAHPFELWERACPTRRLIDNDQLALLASEHDGPTEGHGWYWVGRAILAASLSEDIHTVAKVRRTLNRWRTEDSYGSDAPISRRPPSERRSSRSEPDSASPVDRRPLSVRLGLQDIFKES